jgi:hypothetical protein
VLPAADRLAAADAPILAGELASDTHEIPSH